MEIVIHKEKCCGAGLCVLNAPNVFDQHEDSGIAFVITESIAEQERENVLRAAKICPALAIELKD